MPINKLEKDLDDLLKHKPQLTNYRLVLSYLYDDDPNAFEALYFIRNNYKKWESIFKWLVKNKKRGRTLVEFFENESPDGQGYHCGVQYILSRLRGTKFDYSCKADELL